MKKSKKPILHSRVAEELSRLRLGRYPFFAGIKHYEKRKSIRYTSTTLYEDTRKLHYLSKQFERFKREGRIKTTDPRHMGPDAIEEFYRWMRTEKKLSASTQGTYVRILKRYLELFGNNIID